VPDYLRVKDRHLLTPVRTYTHTDTGRMVTLVSMIHFGEGRYFRGLEAIILRCEEAGAVVLCEGTTPLTEEDLSDATAEERELLDEWDAVTELTGVRVAGLGWTTQMSAMSYPDSWQVLDMGQLELIRMTGLDAMRGQVADLRRMVEWPEHNTWAANLYRIKLVLMLRALAVLTSNNAVPKRPTDAVIHHYRNNLALAGLHDTDRDVVMAWGGRHVAVIEVDLVGHGYVWQADDWHIMGRLPSVGRALWNMLLRRPPADEIRDPGAATALPTVRPEPSDGRENAATPGR
jgi:hypothetical protein